MSTTKRTSAAKARSRNNGRDDSWARAGAEGSLAHRLSESPGGIEGALARLQAATATGRPMTALEKFAAAIGEPAADDVPWTDRTDNQIRAYLASVRPMRDVVHRDDIEEANYRGRSLIERMAMSAEGRDSPRLRLTAGQIADVLSFIRCSEPIDLQAWWNDSDDGPSYVCGFYAVLGALEESLRGEQLRPQGVHS